MNPEGPVEGLYSVASSHASSMSDVPSHLIVDFIGPNYRYIT